MAALSFRDIEPWRTAVMLIAEFGEDAADAASYFCEDLASEGRTEEARNMMSVLCAILTLGPSLHARVRAS